MSDEVRPETISFVWEQAEVRLEAQLGQADALDTKAGVLVGLHALSAGLVATTVPRLQGSGKWVAAAVLLGLAFSGTLAFWAYRSQDYDRAPSPETLWRYASRDRASLQLELLSTRFRAIARNRERLTSKARHLARSLLVYAVVALGVALATVVELIT